MPTEGEKIIIYGTPFCMMIGQVKAVLDRSNVVYEYIDISRNSQAATRVKEINNGYASVPTLQFPDGSTLTEPSVSELRERLQAQNYQVEDLTLLDKTRVFINNPYAYFLGVVLVVFGFAGDNIQFALLGMILLALGLILGFRYRRR
jgi:mycoredoxin